MILGAKPRGEFAVPVASAQSAHTTVGWRRQWELPGADSTHMPLIAWLVGETSGT